MRNMALYLLLLATMASIQMNAQIPRPLSSNPTGVTSCDSGSSVQYRLHASDVIDVTLPFAADYNETATVQPDGRISLREAPPVYVADRTLQDAELAIEAAYKGILNEPKVSVILKDALKPSFYASGEIGKPGRYEIRNNMTLLEALSEAGGMLNERASKAKVVILRPQCNGMYMSTVFDVKKMLKGKSSDEAYVRPGDIIYVPQNRASKIQKYIPTPSIGTFLSPAIV